MDFTLSLTHFCEVHGPKSVLCTQVLPLECALCLPPSPVLRGKESADTLNTQLNDSGDFNHSFRPPILKKTETNITLPTDFSGASTNVESEPDSPTIERHPLFKEVDQGIEPRSQYRYGRAQGDTCASCSFSVPQEVANKLPHGAPGSAKQDAKSKIAAPVLRSREFICLGDGNKNQNDCSGQDLEDGSKPSSLESSFSHHTVGDCHDHTITYLTAKSPEDPQSYTQLRASVIRTLSCELLPRGMSDGPFCFGDSNTGYTIAYVFRLTDPKARGRRRAYAFVALAGKDASRAFRASPMLWEAFATMAKGIEQAAQRHQDEQRQKEEEESANGRRNYTPVSSFLTQRAVDPDGHPRRAGQTTPRSLAEIIGDENIFTILHQYFVAILRCLGDRFGGLPLVDKPSVYQTVANEEGLSRENLPSAIHTEMVDDLDKLRDEDATPTPKMPGTTDHDELDAAKSFINKTMKLKPQCAPLTVSETAKRQVVV